MEKDNKLEEANLHLVESEIAKNKAEENKFNSEAKNMGFNKHTVLKNIIAGIIAAVLLAVWGIGFLKPLIEGETELANLENKILKQKNEIQLAENLKQALQNKQDSIMLDSMKKENQLTLLQLNKLNTDFKLRDSIRNKNITELKIKLMIFETNKILEENRKRINDLLKEMAKTDSLRNNISNISIAISDALISNWLISNTYSIEYSGDLSGAQGIWQFKQNGKINVRNSGHTLDWKIKDGVLTINLGSQKPGGTLTAKVPNNTPEKTDGSGSNSKGQKWTWTMIAVKD